MGGRVFQEKQKLKVTGKTITKSLTTKRIGQLNDARKSMVPIMFGLMMVTFCIKQITKEKFIKTNN